MRIRRRIDSFIIKDGPRSIIDSTRSYAEVSIDYELLRFGFKNWKEDPQIILIIFQLLQRSLPKKFKLFFSSVMEMLEAPLGMVATEW